MIDLITGNAVGYVRAVTVMPIVGDPTHCVVHLESPTGFNDSYELPLWAVRSLRERQGQRVEITRHILEEGYRAAHPQQLVPQTVEQMMAEIQGLLEEER